MIETEFTNMMLPRFDIQVENIEKDLSHILNKNREKLQQLLAQEDYSWESLLQPMEDMNDELHRFWSPISHLHSVMETPELRAAYNKAQPLLVEYHTEIAQNETLYKAIKSIAESAEFKNLPAAQQKIIEHDLRDFKLAGIHLNPDQKKQLAALEQELSQCTTKFSENILDATNAWYLHTENEQDLLGLPEQIKELARENAKRRKLNGFVFTLDYPSFSTALKFLANRKLREQIYTAYATRASNQGPHANQWDNAPIMDRILTIRHEIASLTGFNNYAEYSLATKMAKQTQDVMDFLNDLLNRAKPIAQKESQELYALAKQLDGLETLHAWDVPYYSEKLREAKFNFSQEDLRPYFPVQNVLAGLFNIVQQLFGLRIVLKKDVPTWHKDVQFYAVYDEQDQLRGGFYIDLYARPHKREGAWMDDCQTRRRYDNQLQYPLAFLTCNFMPAVEDKPALLTHDEVLTLFHEFGHTLHHLLTQIDYPSVAGINGVAWDAVEFPSQFMEFFCWEKASLNLLDAHYKTGANLPEDLYQKMLAAKHFQTGLQMVRQLEFAFFDFMLHLNYQPGKKNQVEDILEAARKLASVLPVPAFNRFANSFSHVFAGGYAAGYYSYKWAEVLSADAYEKFEENGIINREIGASFMKNILEVGGAKEAMEAFENFRGRKPKADALLRLSGISLQAEMIS